MEILIFLVLYSVSSINSSIWGSQGYERESSKESNYATFVLILIFISIILDFFIGG